MGDRNKGKKKQGECASPFMLPLKMRSEIRGGGELVAGYPSVSGGCFLFNCFLSLEGEV